MTPGEWAAWLQAGAVTIAVGVAVWQIVEARVTRRNEARAYIVVFLEAHADRFFLPDVVLTNLGRTAASDVRVVYDPPIRSTVYDKNLEEARPFLQDGIPTVAPGQRFATIFDTMLERPRSWEDRYDVTVSYKDVFGKRQSDHFVLDVGPYRGLQSVVHHGTNDIYKQLKELVRELKHLRTGFGGPMPIVASRRGRQRYEAWLRKRFRAWGRVSIPSTLAAMIYAWEWVRDELRALANAAKRLRRDHSGE